MAIHYDRTYSECKVLSATIRRGQYRIGMTVGIARRTTTTYCYYMLRSVLCWNDGWNCTPYNGHLLPLYAAVSFVLE